ncbi:hypothetical protein [Bradyrhizobium archetypum]|uniref:Uncharacterized protein n=1 Tax=Bradyrhizobium archetypum TaxID=2721160 RepID=A0A7Y4M032_9BRAD|nr:hypothetical protein [Bradyrhizobium archetypum]NOJ44956.1 hypothetical protein [Bradyrhizobium archetypum]
MRKEEGRLAAASIAKFGNGIRASEAKQSISRHAGQMDCFVASLLAITDSTIAASQIYQGNQFAAKQ